MKVEPTFSMNKIIFELKTEGMQDLIALFSEYISMHGMRFSDEDFTFIERIFETIGIQYRNFDSFVAECKKQRVEHIEWLVGKCEEDGIKKIPLPKDYPELKKLLLEFDMDWIGEGYCK